MTDTCFPNPPKYCPSMADALRVGEVQLFSFYRNLRYFDNKSGERKDMDFCNFCNNPLPSLWDNREELTKFLQQYNIPVPPITKTD